MGKASGVYLDSFAVKASTSIFEHPTAMKYLAGRAISEGDIRRYGLGYTRFAKIQDNGSDDWRRLKEETFGFKGLENRVIIPLRNIIGRVNGIQTRSLDKKMYKDHMMSEAKAIGAFFGLYEALPFIRATRKVFVHEGAFNCISFSRVFPNSVAALTSFLSEVQVEMLRFLTDLIIVVFDRDEAGDVGRAKLLKTYGSAGFEFVTVGESDANSCLKVMGEERFGRYLRTRVPALLQWED